MDDTTYETRTAFGIEPVTHREKRKVVLRVALPDRPERHFELTRTRISLGRSRNNHVVVDHESVSGVHAELVQIDERIELVDASSRNGTWVNDRWVHRGEIVVGDRIRLGQAIVDLVAFDEIDVPISSKDRLGDLWGASTAMRELFARLTTYAHADISMLITGETGTGKELAARAVHASSKRAHGPFEVVDCGKLVPTLAASTLFGHAKGAFTGADRAVPGAFEIANGGTIFLDEIGELPLDLQTMLLRVLDRGEVTRMGEHTTRPVDVRVVAATHQSLTTMVSEKRFREDLWFRLVECELEMPPLRRRKGDVRLLAHRFVQESEGNLELTAPAVRLLEKHHWPGNVRELRNVLRRAAVLASADRRTRIVEADLRLLPLRGGSSGGDLGDLVRLGSYATILEAVDRAVLPRALDEHGGVMAHAAATLGISRRRYRQRMIELGLIEAGVSKDEDAE